MFDAIQKALGLVSQYNPLTTAPGGLAKANNCVIRRENVIEDRRGYAVDGTLANTISQLVPYQSKVIANNGSLMSYGPSSYLNYSGSYSPPAGLKVRFAEAASNLYVTTSLGIKIFTDVTGTAARSAGMPRMLDPSYVLNAASSGFLAAGSQCAYRSLIQRLDSNSNTIIGYPSSRLWVTNPTIVTTASTHTNTTLDTIASTTGLINGMTVTGTGIPVGTTISGLSGSSCTLSQAATATATGVSVTFSAPRNVNLTVFLPAEAIVGDVVKFYRTAQIAGTSTDGSGDECALIFQYTLASTDISTGSISFTDVTVDALRGESLYTNASQQGISQANDRPPVATDIALFKTFMFYSNCSTKQRLFLTLVGTGSLSGKTITLAGTTYNFGSTEVISGGGSPQVAVGATGVAAADIDTTARSLCRVINRYASNTAVYAYYTSGPSDLPGQIMIEERGIGASAFTAQSSDTAISGMFYPPPPVSPATNSKSTSSNQNQPNAVYFSKDREYEHVPTLNYLLIGAANKKILRIEPLRNSVIVIKEEGIYRITGDSPSSFVATPLDLTVYCKARDSVSTLANQVFMLSNQGVVAISENGVQVVSREIANVFIPLFTNTSLANVTYGIGYESEGQYLISTITNSTDLSQNQTLVFNIYTKTWVRWTFGIAAAMIEPSTDKLYFATPSSLIVNVERKAFDNTDYADPEQSITITAMSTNLVTMTAGSTAPQIGWAVSQGSTSIPILSIMTNPTTYVLTLATTVPNTWALGAATLYPSVGMEIEWLPWVAGNAGAMKQCSLFKILVDSVAGTSTETSVSATFKSNFDDEQETQVLTQSGSGWGDAWGSIPWGGGGDSYGYPTYVPRNKQYCTRLMPGVKHPNALEKVSILGCAFEFEQVSGSIGR